jgi:glycosyltransferase involved in cell wall biosynthesis
MRIGVDCQAFGAGVRHGFTTYLGNLLTALRRRYPDSEFLEWPCQYHAGWRIPHQLWWDQGRIPWRAFRKGVDLIHSPAFSGPLCRTQPLVLTVHDLLYARHPEWLPTKRARWYWAEWIPFTARHASAVIVPSEATKEDLVAIAGLSPKQIAVIPHAIDPLFSQRPSAQAVQAYQAQHGFSKPYILYVGAIDRRKDWKGLLSAFAQVRTRYPAVQLVIAGYMNRQRSNLMEEIEARGDQQGIVLPGHVPDQELPLLYAGAALFVYPSWWEGFGLPPLEAMAMGVPVITYHSSSLPEVVGDAGILLEAPYAPERLAEQMERLLADRAFRCQVVASGLRHVQAFSWDRAAEQTMAVYARCV